MTALSVAINDIQIGLLELFDGYQQQFTFSEAYKNSLISSRPILGQIFEDRIPNPILVDGPICWFSHLLPQGVMRNWRCRILGIDLDDSFSLLEYLGSDLPGAVVLTKTTSPFRRKIPQESEATESAAHEQILKFSLAGVQWKLSARSSGRGLTTRASGGGKYHIAKFHSPEHPELPRREFATMNWAKQAGLVVPNFELRNTSDFDEIPDQMPTGDGSVFVVERFDRSNSRRIHIEDFGQILDRPPGHSQYLGSYDEMGSVLTWIAPNSLKEFLRLIVFNILCGNGDAHLKNFSIIYNADGREPELAPAYDLVSTVLYYPSGKEKLALNLSDNKKFSQIKLEGFKNLCLMCEKLDLDGETTIRNSITSALDAWNSKPIREGYTAEEVKKIERHIKSLPISTR